MGPEIEATAYWLGWINLIKLVAFFIVAVGVVLEFGAELVGKPMERKIEAARELKIAQLTNDAEILRKQNLAFEAAISPRILEQNLSARQLEQFGGMPFIVISPQDFEPKRTAGQIRWMLDQAKWTRFSEPLRQPFGFFSGVTIHIMGRNSPDPSRGAADLLVTILKNNGIEARTGYPMPFRDDQGKPIPPQPGRANVLVIEVGPKPLPESLQLKPENVPADAKGNRVWGNTAE